MDLAEVAGLTLDPWQEHVLRGALGERVDGRWAAFRTCLVVPRQNGKNAILEARELAGLFLFGEKLIIHTAHEHATARESMLALMNRIKAAPDLMELVKGFEGDPDKDLSGMKTGNDPGITLKNGNRLAYRARSKGSGRGFTGDLVVLDEAYALNLNEMAALLPTMAAKSLAGNPQVWFTSSAGMPESDLLASLRQQGIEQSSDRMAYFEWSTPDNTKPDDVEGWYQANPGLGYRISEEFIRDEFETLAEKTGSDEQFKRERLGIWAKLGAESVFAPDVWTACKEESSTAGDEFRLAIDVSPVRDSASIGLASMRPDGVVHVEVVDSREGTSWLPSELAKWRDKYGVRRVLAIAGSQAEALGPDLRREGIRLELRKMNQYAAACGRFYDFVTQGRIAHLGDEVLDAAVDGAQQSWRLDKAAWSWSRKSSEVDITSLVAVTLVADAVEARPSRDSGEVQKKSSGRIVVMGR